jgi:hypothetical protein
MIVETRIVIVVAKARSQALTDACGRLLGSLWLPVINGDDRQLCL